MLNRRHIIGGAAALPAIVIASCGVTPAKASAGSPAFRVLLDRADGARQHYTDLPPRLEVDDPATFFAEGEKLSGAIDEADMATPTNWQEFIRLFEHMTDHGDSRISEKNELWLLDHARRLAKLEA